MDDVVYIGIFTLIFSIVTFGIGALLRIKFGLRAKPVRVHHTYIGLLVILMILSVKQISFFQRELIGLGLGLIIADLVHHKVYKTKW